MPDFWRSLFLRRGGQPNQQEQAGPPAPTTQYPTLNPQSDEFRAVIRRRRTAGGGARQQTAYQMENLSAVPERPTTPRIMLAGGHEVGPARRQYDLGRLRDRITQMEAEGNLTGLENSQRIEEYQHAHAQREYLEETGQLDIPATGLLTGRPPRPEETYFLYTRTGQPRTMPIMRPEDRDLLTHGAESYFNIPFIGTGVISDRMDRAGDYYPGVRGLIDFASPFVNAATVGVSFLKHGVPAVVRYLFRGTVRTGPNLPRGASMTRDQIEMAPVSEEVISEYEQFRRDREIFMDDPNNFWPSTSISSKGMWGSEIESPYPDSFNPRLRGAVNVAVTENRLDDAEHVLVDLGGLSPVEAQTTILRVQAVIHGPETQVQSLNALVERANTIIGGGVQFTSLEQAQTEWDTLMQRGTEGIAAWRSSFDPELHSRGAGGWRASYLLNDGGERWDADNKNIWLFVLQSGRLPTRDEMRQITSVNADAGIEFAWEAGTDVLNYLPIPFLDDLLRATGHGIKAIGRGALGIAEALPGVGRVFRAAHSFFGGLSIRSASYVWARSWGGRLMGSIARASESSEEFFDILGKVVRRELPENERIRYGLTRGFLDRMTGENGLLRAISTPTREFAADDLLRVARETVQEVADTRRHTLMREFIGDITPEVESRIAREAAEYAQDPRNLIHNITLNLQQEYLEGRRLVGLGSQYLDEGLIAWAYRTTDERSVIGRLNRRLRNIGLDTVDAQQLYRDFVGQAPDLWTRHGIPDLEIGALESIMARPGGRVGGLVRSLVRINDFYRGFMGFWTTMVLRARPSFVIYNFIDTSFRALLYGANPFQSLESIFRDVKEMGGFLPEDIRLTLADVGIGGRSLEELASRGELPRNLLDWFQRGASEGFRTGRYGVLSAFTGGMGAMWSGTELTWRARLYLKFYERDVTTAMRMATEWLETAAREGGADELTTNILRQLRYQVSRRSGYGPADPTKMIEVLEMMTGVRTRGRVPLVLDPALFGRLTNLLGNEANSRQVASIIQEAVRETIQQGGSVDDMLRAIRQNLESMIAGFEQEMGAADLIAIRNLGPADAQVDPTLLNQVADNVDNAVDAGVLPEVPPEPPAPEVPAAPDPMQVIRTTEEVAPTVPPEAPEGQWAETPHTAQDQATFREADAQFNNDLAQMEQRGMDDAVGEMRQANSIRIEAEARGIEAAETTHALMQMRSQLRVRAQAAVEAATRTGDAAATREAVQAAAQDVAVDFYLGDIDQAIGRFSRIGSHRDWLLDFPLRTSFGRSRAANWRRFNEVVAAEYRAQTIIMERYLRMSPEQLRTVAASGNLFSPMEFLQAAGYEVEFDITGRLTRVAHPASGLFDSAYGSWGSEIDRFLRGIESPVGRNGDVFSWMNTPLTIQTNPATGMVIGAEEIVAREAAQAVTAAAEATAPLEVPPATVALDELDVRYGEIMRQGGQQGEIAENGFSRWLEKAAANPEASVGFADEGILGVLREQAREGEDLAQVVRRLAQAPPIEAPVADLLQLRRERANRQVWRALIGLDDAGNPVGKGFSFSGGGTPLSLYGRARLPDGRRAIESFDSLAEYIRGSLQRAIDAEDWTRVATLRGRLAELSSRWELDFANAAAGLGLEGVAPGIARFRYPSREMMDPNVVAFLRAVDDREGLITQLRGWVDDFTDNINTRIRDGDVLLRQVTSDQQAIIDRIGRQYIDLMAEGEQAVMNGGAFLGRDYRGAVNMTNRYMISYHEFSPFDRMMKQAIPFWMFPSRSIPFWIETMVHHPELVGWYLRYMSNTSMVVWQWGFVNSRGEALPSMRGLIPLGNGVWWNPTGPLSMRYVFPTLDYWDVQEMNDNDMTFAQAASSIALRTLSMFGASPAPWIPILFRATGAVDADIYQPLGLFPQASLVPPFAEAYLKRQARQTTWGRVAMEILDPDVNYIDFLVNRQILIDTLEAISDPSMTDEERWVMVHNAEGALDMYARGDNPDAQHLWNQAYGHIQTDDWITSTIGYFTGLYPRMHTDADANLIRTRMEINQLRLAINNAVGARIFNLDQDIEQSWSWLVNNTYEVPENYLSTLYTTFSWVKVPSGSEPYDPTREAPDDYYQRINRTSSSYENVDGMSYNVIVAMNIESQRQRQEYLDERERIRQERDRSLQALPVGTSPAILSEIYRRYAEETADLETRYPLAPRDWVVGYKPEQLVFEDFRNLWWYTLLDSAPHWDPERYESYDNFQQDYQAWLERLPEIATPMMREMQTKFAEAGFMNAEMNRPEDISIRLIGETNAQGLEAWRIEQDDVYEALNYVWVHNYQEPYYDAMGRATNSDARQLIERNFLAGFGPDGRPTEDQMVGWIRERYGDRFTERQIMDALYGRAVMSMQARQEQNSAEQVGQAAASRDDRIWDLLNRIPPGTAYDTFLDTFRQNGGNDAWVDIFRATDSTAYWRDGDDVQSFENVLLQTLNQLGYNQRVSDEELARRSQAREENDQFRGVVEGRLGAEFWTTLSWYMGLSQSERADAREQDPTVKARIDQYYDMKDAWGTTHPVWASYYLEATVQATGGDGGGGRRATGGGGGRAATPQMPFIPLGYRGVEEGRELLKSGKKLGSGGAGGKLPAGRPISTQVPAEEATASQAIVPQILLGRGNLNLPPRPPQFKPTPRRRRGGK